jgi:hypothetical protein
MNFLKGKLTYIVAGITGIWAITGFFLGQLGTEEAGVLILASLGTFGIRRAIN